MQSLSRFQRKALSFLTSLNNAYRDEEEREELSKLELKEEELTEDFTAMLMAMLIFYQKITDESEDLIGFTHILNRLAVQHVMEKKDEGEDDGIE